MQIEHDIVARGVASTETLGQGEFPTDEIYGRVLAGLTDD